MNNWEDQIMELEALLNTPELPSEDEILSESEVSDHEFLSDPILQGTPEPYDLQETFSSVPETYEFETREAVPIVPDLEVYPVSYSPPAISRPSAGNRTEINAVTRFRFHLWTGWWLDLIFGTIILIWLAVALPDWNSFSKDLVLFVMTILEQILILGIVILAGYVLYRRFMHRFMHRRY